MYRGGGVSMMELLVIVMLVVLLDVAAVVFGADSRDGNDWIEHRLR
jgi:hypothetical protein